MERSHPPSGRSATPADINRNDRPTSIGIGGRHQSECPADIIGIRNLRLVAQINAPGQPDDVTDAENDAVNEIEDQIEATVPISASGAIVLLRFLQNRMRSFEWDETDDQIVDNLIAGLERLGKG
jgi:hypothetical protein